MKLTTTQKEELISLIEIRLDTIESDPESADEFELIENSLDYLKDKIQDNNLNFTEMEKEWLTTEIENSITIAEGNKGHGLNKQIAAFVKSMQNILNAL